ncbi:carboxymuconolactone decarboxylase family protein [Chryseobacterium suipulveris]|uniref:Carboxymuconolactone decarboxylase family protein n=1 Tax=Chryseobacterium suipulveris TaxID=2929800 RepID=A0ABY4BL94_9FLAO|nr:carboxymuconolactone decarboxylase family protein [Chryseobacterium suipulveris]UOE39963.1 carboxymuconolactone decarboxylase family protein [Chryseobacterium suipulveris]
MMKNKTLRWLILFVLTVSITKMYAQQNTITNPTLSPMQQSLVNISALTAAGNLLQLKPQLNKGLDSGLTINEIKETLVQLYAYCGFPRSLNALNTFKVVLDERKAKGITDSIGKQIIVEDTSSDKYEQGRKVLEVLTKVSQSKPALGFGEFAPRIDAFLKEHLFADIFNSDVLSYQQRELVTISALASMPGVEPQLQAHITMGINTGITKMQLMEVFSLIEESINKTQADTARSVLSNFLINN